MPVLHVAILFTVDDYIHIDCGTPASRSTNRKQFNNNKIKLNPTKRGFRVFLDAAKRLEDAPKSRPRTFYFHRLMMWFAPRTENRLCTCIILCVLMHVRWFVCVCVCVCIKKTQPTTMCYPRVVGTQSAHHI